MPAVIGATVTDGHVKVHALGTIAEEPDPGSLGWEIGSITKVFTGILLADASIQGDVSIDDPIGLYVPAEVASRLPAPELQPTLADLAAHTSGLPRLPRSWLRQVGKSTDPYAALTEQMVWDVLGPDTVKPKRPRSRYSNYGVGLLGHLLARVAELPYEELVKQTVLVPLGMGASDATGELDVVQGFKKGKQPTPPWTFGAVAAAGAIRSTVADMVRFALAVIEPPEGQLGEAIQLSMQPVFEGRIQKVGLGWQLRPTPPGRPGGTVWHNGGTYGGSSFLAVNPEQRRAVISFGNVGPRLRSPLDSASWKLFDSLD